MLFETSIQTVVGPGRSYPAMCQHGSGNRLLCGRFCVGVGAVCVREVCAGACCHAFHDIYYFKYVLTNVVGSAMLLIVPTFFQRSENLFEKNKKSFNLKNNAV